MRETRWTSGMARVLGYGLGYGLICALVCALATGCGSPNNAGPADPSPTDASDPDASNPDAGTGPRAAVLVGNSRGNDIVRYDAATGAFLSEFVAESAGGLEAPDTLLVRDGMLYVSSGESPETSAILRYDAATGAFVDSFAAGGGMHRPYGFAFDTDGDGALYVASFLTDQILRFDADGTFVDVFAQGDALPGGLNGPDSLAFGPDGALYVTTQGSVAVNGVPTFPGLPSEVLRYDVATGAATVFADQPTPLPDSVGFVSMLGLAFGPDCPATCDAFTTDFANGLRRHDGATGALLDQVSTTYVFEDRAAGNFTGALAFGADGEIYVPGFDNRAMRGELGAVMRFDAANLGERPGDSLPGAVFIDTDERLHRPIGVAFVPAE